MWEDVDEINQRELYGATRSSKEVKEDQFLETWQPADTQLDFLSFTKLWGDDLVEELSKLTGCVLQSSPERRQIQIAGKDRESAERSKGMLEILERHFVSIFPFCGTLVDGFSFYNVKVSASTWSN